jgi:hypothetical protein
MPPATMRPTWRSRGSQENVRDLPRQGQGRPRLLFPDEQSKESFLRKAYRDPGQSATTNGHTTLLSSIIQHRWPLRPCGGSAIAGRAVNLLLSICLVVAITSAALLLRRPDPMTYLQGDQHENRSESPATSRYLRSQERLRQTWGLAPLEMSQAYRGSGARVKRVLRKAMNGQPTVSRCLGHLVIWTLSQPSTIFLHLSRPHH